MVLYFSDETSQFLNEKGVIPLITLYLSLQTYVEKEKEKRYDK